MNNINKPSGYLLTFSVREDPEFESHFFSWWQRSTIWAREQFGPGFSMQQGIGGFSMPDEFTWGYSSKPEEIDLTVIQFLFRKKTDRMAFILAHGEQGEMTITDNVPFASSWPARFNNNRLVRLVIKI